MHLIKVVNPKSFLARFFVLLTIVVGFVYSIPEASRHILLGYYNWDSVLYTYKIYINDFLSYISFGRIVQYGIGKTWIELFLLLGTKVIEPHNILAILSLVCIVLLSNLVAHILQIKTWLEYFGVFALFISMPSILFIGTTVLSEGLVLVSVFTTIAFHFQWLRSAKSKYLLLTGFLLFITAGLREYFFILSIALLFHTVWTGKNSKAYNLMVVLSVLFSIAVYYFLLPNIFGISYGNTRYKYIAKIVTNENNIIDRMLSLINSFTYNVTFSIILAIGIGLLVTKPLSTQKDVQKILMLLFGSSVFVLCIYGDPLSMRRYVVFALVPLVVIIFDLIRTVRQVWIRNILFLLLLLHVGINIPRYTGMWNYKKKLISFTIDCRKVLSKEKQSVVIIVPTSVESAILKYSLSPVENYKIIVLDKLEYIDSLRFQDAQVFQVTTGENYIKEFNGDDLKTKNNIVNLGKYKDITFGGGKSYKID